MPKRKCSNIDLSVGQRMKLYRIGCNLTQQQVADILNINRTTYTKYETGVSEPSHDLLGKICAIFGVDYNAVLAGKDEPERVLRDPKGETLKMDMLSEDERFLVANYRSLPKDVQKEVSEYIHGIVVERRQKFL